MEIKTKIKGKNIYCRGLALFILLFASPAGAYIPNKVHGPLLRAAVEVYRGCSFKTNIVDGKEAVSCSILPVLALTVRESFSGCLAVSGSGVSTFSTLVSEAGIVSSFSR